MRSLHAGLVITCVLLVPVAPAAADFFGGLQKLFDDWGLFQGLQISGQNSLTFQGDWVEGSRAAYEGQRWDTGSLVRRSSLHIEGPIWRNLGVQMDISSSGWGPSYTRYVVGWTGEKTALYYGDLNVRLAGNEFATFSKTLQGWQVDQMLPGGGLLRGFYSVEKALTRRQFLSGNNTSGPYFLTYTPIVEGSEVIKVDEQLMRFGVDYRLDYETGQLWFEPVDRPPRIIPSTSVIAASYQSYGWQTSPGVLYGARAEMPLLDGRMRVGVTAVMQDKRDPGSARDTAGYQEDIFQASGTTGPFDVNYRPILTNGASVVYQGVRRTIDQPLVVLVDNVEQIEGVDYDSFRQIGRIIFRRAVPPTALVIIRYYYDLGTNEVARDQRVYGLDLGYRITDDLILRTDYAQSAGGNADGQGSAWRSSLQYSRPRLSATLEYRDVQPEFTYLDSVGFYRNERGLNFAGQWQINDYISLYDRYSDLSSNQGLSFGYSGGYGITSLSLPASRDSLQMAPAQTIDPIRLVQTKRHDFGVDVRYPGWPSLSISRQVLGNAGGTYGDSTQTADNVRLFWSPEGKPLTVSVNLSNTGQDYKGGAAVSGNLYQPRSSDTSQIQGTVTWSPMRTLSLSANLGHNRATATDAEMPSTSEVRQLSLQWNPSSRLSLSVDHTMAHSLGAVTSGFYGGGYGYGGYGNYSNYGSYYTTQVTPGLPFNPGGGGSGGTGGEEQEPARYEDANTRFSLTYRPSDRLNFALTGGMRRYTSGGGVGYLADSDQTYYNLSAGWQPHADWSLNATWGKDDLVFLEEGRGAVRSDMLSLALNYQPSGSPWGLGLNLQSQQGSSPTYIGFGNRQISRIVPTDLFDISGQVTYELANGATLFGRLGRARFESGYSNFQKDSGEIGLSYRISDWADLTLGYRYIRNIAWEPDLPLPGFSPVGTTGQNYIAHNLMLGFTTSFHSGLGTAGSTTTTGTLRSFGGYQIGTGLRGSYGLGTWGSPGIGGFGGYDTRGFGGFGGYGPGGYGSTGFGTMPGGFSSGWFDTWGQTSYPNASGGFDTGLGQFQQTGREDTTAPHATPQPQAPPAAPETDAPTQRRWWQWE